MSGGDFSIGGRLWPGLSKLIEEIGEVGQVAGKIIGNEGRSDHWDGTDLRERMQSEVGDLLAAIDFLVETNGLSDGAIAHRRAEKLRLFRQWHRETLNDRDVAG